jgi:hypothetical protein
MMREEAGEYIAYWKRVGPLLEQIRRDELRNYRFEDHITEVHALMEFGGQLGQPRLTSGLVEQQRLFHRTAQ